MTNMTKYLSLGLLSFMVHVGHAQQRGDMPQHKNTLLNTSFWQNKPSAEEVRSAVAKGNDPSELNDMAMDPIVLAINADAPKESIVFLLEQKGNAVDKLTHDTRTYIFWAAMRGNLEIVQYLIAKGANVKAQDSHGMTPLSFAALAGQPNTKVYDVLIQNGENLETDLNGDGANALLLAIGNDTSFALTEYFQSKGLSLHSKDAEGNTAFDYAAKSGNIKAMERLRQKGIPYSNNSLLMAAQGGRRNGNTLEVFQYLENMGIKPTVTSKNGENVLHAIARRTASREVVQHFLGKGVDADQKDKEGNTPFMKAASGNQDTVTVGRLLAKVKNINEKNNAGASALALAVRNNSAQVVRYLLAAGADVNTVDKSGNSLVSYLFESYNPRQAKEFQLKVKALQDLGLAITAPLQDGSTMYHLAVAKNDLSLVKMVHDNYAVDINAKNKEGITALQKAAMVSKDDHILKYLFAIGADKQLKTNFDETAFALAGENELLKKNKVSIDFLK